MYKQIAQNKRRTVIIMIIFVLMIAVIAGAFAYFYRDPWIAVWTIVVAIVYAVIQYFAAGSIATVMTGAREIAKKDNPRLYNIVENLSITTGLPMPKVYVIDDAELERVKKSYPVMWKNPDATPKLCFVGCPHLSLEQLKDWTDKIEASLKESFEGVKKLVLDFTALEYLSSAGLRVILQAQKTMNKQGEMIIKNVNEILSIMDIQVNASYISETTNLSLLEGLSIGVPVVATDCGGSKAIIKGDNGKLVEKENSVQLAKAIEEILNDKENVYKEVNNALKKDYES